MRRKSLVFLATVITMLVVGLTLLVACQPREHELSFETIERRDWPGGGKEQEAREPGLMVIAVSKDLDQMGNLFTQNAQTQLREMSFDTYFVVAAFLGWQPTGHEGIQVERVVRQGDEVSVYVQVGRPSGDTEVTSPYHVVKVRKEGNWSQTIHFTLYMDGAVTASLSHFIP